VAIGRCQIMLAKVDFDTITIQSSATPPGMPSHTSTLVRPMAGKPTQAAAFAKVGFSRSRGNSHGPFCLLLSVLHLALFVGKVA
jgi:hypothetical protein